jgi:hypothetical protein
MREIADRLYYIGENRKAMRRIALVGTASSGAHAPYHDESWEIWGVSARAPYVTRANRWFELHRLAGEPGEWAKIWRETIKTFSSEVDLYMFYPEPDLGPHIVEYPHERITARFGTYFMTSTFSWMMALAIDELRPADGEPVDGEIAVFGVDMEYGTEYAQQRSGFRHYMDLARAMGIPITRLASSGLSYEPVPYPMWQDDPLLNKLDARQTDSRNKLLAFDEAISKTRTMIAQTGALIAEIRQSDKDGYDKAARLAALEKEHASLMETSALLSKDIVHFTAAEEEQQWLRDYLAP